MVLNPIVNQLRPPRTRNKIYGRKRHIPLELRDTNCRLFGGDDTTGIENGLGALRLCDKPLAQAGKPNSPVIPNTKETPGQTKPRTATKPKSRTEPAQNDHRDDNNENALKTQFNASPKVRSTKSRPRMVSEEAGALELVLRQPRMSSSVRRFATYGARLTKEFDISKLSEGSYSECFVIRKHGQMNESAVLKVIPFDCRAQKASKAPTYAHDFLREVKLLTALEQYHGFAQIFEGQVVRGRMHDKLVQAARNWSAETAEDLDKTIDPATRYPDNQVFGVVEMAFAGQDLELLKQPSAFQAFDAFWMAVVLISKAEADIQFEHRDLHMSNICFRPGDGGSIDVSQDYIKGMKTAPTERLGLSGLQISIIDYTHSRMKDPQSGEILFNPECPFTAEDLEFYRENGEPCDQMDTVVKAETWMSKCFDQKSNECPKYHDFTPRTNVIWLAHVLHQLTLHVQRAKKQTSVAGSSPAAKKLQTSIWETLADVLQRIGSPDLDSLPDSAAAFLDEAIDDGHISRKEVDAFMKRLNADS